MSSASDGWIKLATKLIIQNGRAEIVTASRTQVESYDTGTLTAAPSGDDLTWQVYAAPLDYGTLRYNDAVEKNENNDTQSNKECYIPGGVGPDGQTYVPQVGDTILLDQVYRVLAVKNTFETNSVQCAYLLNLGV